MSRQKTSLSHTWNTKTHDLPFTFDGEYLEAIARPILSTPRRGNGENAAGLRAVRGCTGIGSLDGVAAGSGGRAVVNTVRVSTGSGVGTGASERFNSP